MIQPQLVHPSAVAPLEQFNPGRAGPRHLSGPSVNERPKVVYQDDKRPALYGHGTIVA
jgi:hypothetical protein